MSEMTLQPSGVIFDVNAYRSLTGHGDANAVARQVDQLIELETAAKVRAYAAPVVALELAKHLVDEQATAVRPAMAALYAHTSNSGAESMRLVADPDSMVCQRLYGDVPAAHQQTTHVIAALCRSVWESPESSPRDEPLRIASEISAHINSTETMFAEDIFEMVVSPLDSGVRSWEQARTRPALNESVRQHIGSAAYRRQFAEALAMRAAALMNRSPSPAALAEHVTSIENEYSVAVQLYGHVMFKVVVDGVRLDRNSRSNWLWDVHHCLYVGSRLSNGQSLHLVTQDRDMLRAASLAGAGAYVLDYREYRNWLRSRN
jgi:hypothetical protein